MGLRSLELFAGAGGGILGTTHLLGWQSACYVEWDNYAQRVLQARIQDGLLCDAPIWDDVRTFNAHEWKGQVDVVSGGFPCQAFSTAARGRNNAPDLWPEMLQVVRGCEPRFVFAENVQEKPIRLAAEALVELGYESRFARISAAHLGAAHHRPRWWLVADAHSESEPRCTKHVEVASIQSLSTMALWNKDISETLGMVDGMAHRMDRLRALGNGQVPVVAATAWRLLRGAR